MKYPRLALAAVMAATTAYCAATAPAFASDNVCIRVLDKDEALNWDVTKDHKDPSRFA